MEFFHGVPIRLAPTVPVAVFGHVLEVQLRCKFRCGTGLFRLAKGAGFGFAAHPDRFAVAWCRPRRLGAVRRPRVAPLNFRRPGGIAIKNIFCGVDFREAFCRVLAHIRTERAVMGADKGSIGIPYVGRGSVGCDAKGVIRLFQIGSHYSDPPIL